ncbi:pyridoxamine 5'-phosphate oxidase family protein [Gymnodinialimonas sp. 2305UL16-5]|uniref:FAD-binding oxidoreductase n=1 Tax=Gymnodinialimonas mytili TaxID=3126503 RepID=UPI0030B60E29
MDPAHPFHDGELRAQAKAGVGDVAKWAGGFIRDYLPDQHRAFHSGLPCLVVAGGDLNGHIWVTLVDGSEGFVASPNPHLITLATTLEASDPLASAFASGADVGVLGIELASRRRNRFSGHVTPSDQGYRIDIRQSFGNCPQYIHQRAWIRIPKTEHGRAQHSRALTPSQIGRINDADTMFIGSGHQGTPGAASNGYDASHRGGAPGFVHVVDGTHLKIPDYAGNNFFNTIGNIMSDPRIGLLFVDFATGGLLHISGRATVDWHPRDAHDPDAWRMIDVEIDAVIDRPNAVGLRWENQDHLSRRLRLTRRENETDQITSFYFEPVDHRPLAPFEAGQHLPIAVQIPGQVGLSRRSYSLSGSPAERGHYRLTVKRETQGLVSGFLHWDLRVGDMIEAQDPSGNFTMPCHRCPLVLVSAGVGQTPMIALLHATATQDRAVWYVHGAANGRQHALRGEVDRMVSAQAHLQQRVFYSDPDDEDVIGRDYDVAGRMTATDLLKLGAGPNARYMLCGPAVFLSDIRDGLETQGVPADHIHVETFGPVA